MPKNQTDTIYRKYLISKMENSSRIKKKKKIDKSSLLYVRKIKTIFKLNIGQIPEIGIKAKP